MIPYLVEFLGTFIFLSVIVSVGKPVPIALVGYVVAQVLGGAVALYFYNMNKSA